MPESARMEWERMKPSKGLRTERSGEAERIRKKSAEINEAAFYFTEGRTILSFILQTNNKTVYTVRAEQTKTTRNHEMK